MKRTHRAGFAAALFVALSLPVFAQQPAAPAVGTKPGAADAFDQRVPRQLLKAGFKIQSL